MGDSSLAVIDTTDATSVIDTDTHVTEPFDLWTSRLPSKWRDQSPHVAVHPDTGHHHWKVGDTWLAAVGYFAYAGWDRYPPDMPWELDDIDPGAYDPAARLERMDQYGIHAQVLYPNLIGFEAPLFMSLGDDISVACVAAYNDFLLDFSAIAPDRFIPIAMVPFWNHDAAVKEIERCAGLGYRGILFANKYEQIGMPHFCDPAWDRIFGAAQAADLSINFHVGFASAVEGNHTEEKKAAARRNFDPGKAARLTSVGIMTNADSIAAIVTSGLCDRFPRLKFVSVESGFGYITYLLDSLDWHWRGYGAHLNSPLLPSEYFRRQCYGTFWFETNTLPLLETYPDNFMFETDYPHPTSMAPGPVSPAQLPKDHIARYFAGVDPAVARKALHDNAAHVYRM